MLHFQLSSEKREFPFSPATLEQQLQLEKQQLYAATAAGGCIGDPAALACKSPPSWSQPAAPFRRPKNRPQLTGPWGS